MKLESLKNVFQIILLLSVYSRESHRDGLSSSAWRRGSTCRCSMWTRRRLSQHLLLSEGLGRQEGHLTHPWNYPGSALDLTLGLFFSSSSTFQAANYTPLFSCHTLAFYNLTGRMNFLLTFCLVSMKGSQTVPVHAENEKTFRLNPNNLFPKGKIVCSVIINAAD